MADKAVAETKFCINKDCGKDLTKVSPIYGMANNLNALFCSRSCRATLTGEDPGKPQTRDTAQPGNVLVEATGKGEKKAAKPAPGPVAVPSKATGKKAAAPAPAAAGKGKAPAAPAPRASKPAATGSIKILKPNQVFRGDRGAAWAVLKDGMTVAAYIAACDKAGVPNNQLSAFARVDAVKVV